MLVVMIGVRKALDYVFTQRELKILDDIMPEMARRASVESKKKSDKDKEVNCKIEYFFQIFEINLINSLAHLHNYFILKKRNEFYFSNYHQQTVNHQ